MNLILAGCILIATTTPHIQTIQATKTLKLRSQGQALVVYRCASKVSKVTSQSLVGVIR